MKIVHGLKNIAFGYLGLIKKIMLWNLFIAFSIVFSAAIIYPLWYVALHYTQIFSWITGIILSGVLLFSIIRFVHYRIRIEGGVTFFLKSLIPVSLVLLKIAISLLMIYFALSAWFFGYALLAAGLVVAFLLVAGIFMFSRRSSGE